MKRLKILFISILSCALALSVMMNANAYIIWAYGWPTPNPAFNYYAVDSGWQNVLYMGFWDWLNANCKGKPGTDPNSSNMMSVDNIGEACGMTTCYFNSLGKVNRIDIIINGYKINDVCTANPTQHDWTKMTRSVTVHELGHALKLSDNNSYSPSVMNQNRNRSVIYLPQQDDKAGVNAAY